MNVNWALVPELPVPEGRKKLGKREKRPVLYRIGLEAFMAWARDAGLEVTPPPVPIEEPAEAVLR